MIMKEAKKIAWFNKVWSRDGNILTFDQSDKIFNVKTLGDLRFVKAKIIILMKMLNTPVRICFKLSD